jgi:hypothetical protein
VTKFVEGRTDARLAVPAMPDPTALDSCGDKKPEWFLPKPLTNDQAWKPKTKTNDGYGIYRDKGNCTLVVCDQQL